MGVFVSDPAAPSLRIVAPDDQPSPETGVDSGPRAGTDPNAVVEHLYRAHHQLVFKLALRYGRGDRSWAEDRMQEVFLALLPRADRVLALGNPAGWFYRTTTNRCLNRLRWERVRNAEPVRWLLGQSPGPRPDPEHRCITDERLRRVAAALDDMNPKQRACFMMFHLDGKTQTEIAEIVGHSIGYVSKMIKRVEQRLAAAEEQEARDDAQP